ncbi:MAG: GAF domain-containing protein, partial [Byssovorax sp.]
MQDSSIDAILPRGGEMGALARQTDWSRTPLGPVTAWPQSLRSVAGLVLVSEFPMYLAWGPDYIQLYNDGYRPILGSSKHPAAMGARASETFAESWHIIGPMFDDVRRGIACGSKDWMLPLDRNGYLEECFFTFSYSPILDEGGVVGGVHVTVVETTESVLEARRLRALKALSDQLARATTPERIGATAMTVLQDYREDVPFALVYLFSPGEQAARLVGAMGLPEGPSESAPLIPMHDGGEGWPLHKVLKSGVPETVTDLQARFGPLRAGPWPEAISTAVVLPLLDQEHESPFGMLVVGVSPRREIDPRYQDFFSRVAAQIAVAMVRARSVENERRRATEARAVAEAERARLYNHFMQAPFSIAVTRGPEHTIELANRSALELWGKTSAVVGKALLAAFPELVGQPFLGYLDGVLKTGIAYEGKEELARLARGADGGLEDVFLNFVYSPLRSHQGGI